jgi:heterodisulfide reductase subunit C
MAEIISLIRLGDVQRYDEPDSTWQCSACGAFRENSNCYRFSARQPFWRESGAPDQDHAAA